MFAGTWFGEIVLRSLTFGPRPAKDIIRALGEAARATADWRDSIEMLLGYLETVGLIALEGEVVHPVATAGEDEASASSPETTKAPTEPSEKPSAPPRAAPAVKKSHGGEDMGPNGIRFTVTFDVNMQEMAGWTPERISAFFAGLAKVITAKQGGEVKD